MVAAEPKTSVSEKWEEEGGAEGGWWLSGGCASCLEGAGEEQSVLTAHVGHSGRQGELERLLVGPRPRHFLWTHTHTHTHTTVVSRV